MGEALIKIKTVSHESTTKNIKPMYLILLIVLPGKVKLWSNHYYYHEIYFLTQIYYITFLSRLSLIDRLHASGIY